MPAGATPNIPAVTSNCRDRSESKANLKPGERASLIAMLWPVDKNENEPGGCRQ
jgi:hypothetical protein